MVTKNMLFLIVRNEKHMTQKEFAKAMGLKRLQTICEYENDSNISLDKLIRLQAYYESHGEDQQVLNIINNHVELEIKKIKEFI